MSETPTNRILEVLPSHERALLDEHLVEMSVGAGTVLQEVDCPIDNIYFVSKGMISLQVPLEDGRGADAGAVGRQGVLFSQVAIGVTWATLRAIANLPAVVHRVPSTAFASLLGRCPVLDGAIRKHNIMMLELASQLTVCNLSHEVRARLARWLLVASLQTEGTRFRLTHEMLSEILGVRRPSLTKACRDLAHLGAVSNTRGMVAIADASLLRGEACECTWRMEASITRFSRSLDPAQHGAQER